MERLIIDTDPGEDDALAIMMAAVHPRATIEAITVVAGNVGLGFTTNNVGVILDALDLDIPFYPGCKGPLVVPGQDAAFAHGLDGLGNSGLRSARAWQKTHAVLALIDRVNAAPGDLTLVALGPLTNIATALKIDPELPRKLKRTVAMAGAVTGHGNTTIAAEFNVLADPEAAYAVFHGWGQAGCHIELVDWELATRNGFSQAERARWVALNSARAAFFATISAHSNRFIEAVRGRTVQYFADPVAMAVALEPQIVTRRVTHNVTVELGGTTSRGATIVDWLDVSGRPANAHITMEMDHGRLLELAREAQR